jgi:LuxR family maltose regulon positive regulatory protein
LSRDNRFVVSLDDHDEWYRYHHLFRELLQTRLERQEAPELVRELHARAAEWHHAHGDEESAVRHWLAAGDVGSTGAPALIVCQELVDRGQTERAKQLLDEFRRGEAR